MIRMFRSKKISVLIVAAIVLALLLICMLLAMLSQWTSLKQRAERLKVQIQEQAGKEVELNDLLDFMKSDEYVRRWAESNGRMSQDDIRWMAEHLGSNN